MLVYQRVDDIQPMIQPFFQGEDSFRSPHASENLLTRFTSEQQKLGLVDREEFPRCVDVPEANSWKT